MDSRIWSAVLVQTKGLGSSFQVSIQARMSALRSRTERCAPRRSFLVVSSAYQRSTRLSHELLVGVKCRRAAERGIGTPAKKVRPCLLAVLEIQTTPRMRALSR